MTLELDDAIQAVPEAATCDKPTAVALEPKDSPSHLSVISGKLACPPGGLESGKSSLHLRITK